MPKNTKDVQCVKCKCLIGLMNAFEIFTKWNIISSLSFWAIKGKINVLAHTLPVTNQLWVFDLVLTEKQLCFQCVVDTSLAATRA